jgi:hypothetical protein
LGTELVTRKGEDVESLLAVLVLKRTQTCVLRGESSLARDVDNQRYLVLESLETDAVAGDALHLELVELTQATALRWWFPAA